VVVVELVVPVDGVVVASVLDVDESVGVVVVLSEPVGAGVVGAGVVGAGVVGAGVVVAVAEVSTPVGDALRVKPLNRRSLPLAMSASV
jgi:hypothetical protein